MVMHARKPQRMNDGYFEKHQTHPYQNSKYGSSKSYGSSSDRYEKFRDSPNGNYRSDSPDSQSPRDRDRSYQSKSSYLQKIREKERENRDYKMSRDKYSDCARSPKDKRNRDTEHRTNNDRNDEKSILHPIKVSQNSSRDRKPMHNNCLDKRDERDRVPRVGDWSEHVSSSGKKYYYNCKTEVSQWEKPREWLGRERERFRSRDRERDRESDRNYSSSSRSGMRHEKHSNSRGPNSNSGAGNTGSSGGPGGSSSKDGRESATGSSGGGRHWSSGSSRDDSDVSMKEARTNRKHSDDDVQVTQDMDISPGDSTPTSETSYGNSASNQPTPEPTIIGPVLLANALPRLISHPVPSVSVVSTATVTQMSPAQSVATSQTSIVNMTMGGVGPTVVNAPGPPVLSRLISTAAATTTTGALSNAQLVQQDLDTKGMGGSVDGGCGTPLTIDTSNHNSGMVVEGPPTPTHSETPDCAKVAVPATSPPSTATGLPSMQGMSSSLQALRPQGPTITPSLANHYRDDLVNHVRGWPADILEKQAQKLAEEAHIMGSIQCSKVSAELKSARSIVRLTEIQATLQEQRILFLRQQIKELEELKSQNSFMSDDS